MLAKHAKDLCVAIYRARREFDRERNSICEHVARAREFFFRPDL